MLMCLSQFFLIFIKLIFFIYLLKDLPSLFIFMSENLLIFIFEIYSKVISDVNFFNGLIALVSESFNNSYVVRVNNF